MNLWQRMCVALGLAWARAHCFFAGHGKEQYGGAEILKIDRDKHAIEYANRKICSRCGKLLRLEF